MTEAELARLYEEYRSLAHAIEKTHPGCLRRFDRWSSEGRYVHGIIGGRSCPASDHHIRRREILRRYIELCVAPAAEPHEAR